MIDFDEAIALVAGAARPLGVETVRLEEAAGRVLAAPLVAMVDSPRRDVSAMDGYAVSDADLVQLPARLRIIGESFAGQAEVAGIEPGSCVRIFTGGSVPGRADRVVIQEHVRRDGDFALIDRQPGSARHIRRQGFDFRAGDTLLGAGALLNARTLVAAAGTDCAQVDVYRPPRFVVLGTGDELAEPGCARATPAAIPESVSFGVAAMGEQWGGRCVGRRRLADDQAQLEAAAAQALDGVDLVVVTGGASVGEKDYAKAMFGEALELVFSKVAIKPGKPVWLGRLGGKLVLGLPGNPTSALVTSRLILAPLLCRLTGRDPGDALRWRKAPLAAPLPACGERETFVRARWSGDAVEPVAEQDSGAQKALAEAELLIRRRAGAPAITTGQAVEMLDF